MEETPKSLINIYTYAFRQFYNLTGLIFSLVVPLVFISLISSFFLQFEKLDNTVLSFLATAQFYVILYSIISLLILVFWLIKRSVPKIKKGMIGVLFGPAHTDEIRKEMRDLSTKLKNEIESKDFAKIISVKTLPPNIEVGEHLRNLHILDKANATVLICGNFESFTAKGQNVTGFTSFTISSNRLPVNPQHTPTLLADAVAGRQLAWTSKNTIHKNVVINNLSEIARYIVGLGLLTDSKYNNAQLILAPLLIEIEQKYNKRRLPVEIIRFKNTIRKAYVVSLVNEVSEEYNNQLVNENLFSLDERVLRKWGLNINEALKLDSNNLDALLVLAILKFLAEDLTGAKEMVRKTRTCCPSQGLSLCDISEAFLLCFEGNLRDARKIYRRLINNSPPDFKEMNNVFSFLHQAIEKYTSKPQIRFAYALLNDEFGDKAIATEEFEKFLSETEDREAFNRWRREASIRISKNNAIDID